MRAIRFDPAAWDDFPLWIDDEHRLVYRADDHEVRILKARYHY